MDVVTWFLGIHFARRFTPSLVSVHLNQSGFASNLVESFFQDSRNVTHMATPYRSGVPINSIAPTMDDDDSPAQLCRTAAYQSLIGSIGWLTSSTCPDLTAVHSFLASYSNKSSVGHMKADLYTLHKINLRIITVSCLRWTQSLGYTATSISLLQQTSKHIRMLYPLHHQLHPLFLHTAMLIGVFRSVMWLLMVPYFLFSNSEV